MSPLINFIKHYYFIITTIVLIFITLASLTPFQHLPVVSGSDKMHHLISYAVLFFPVSLARPKNWLMIGVLFAFWSGTIELIQPYVNRHGEWLDMLANCVGLMCGFILAKITNKLVK